MVAARPQSFHVVRAGGGTIIGFYCMFDPTTMDATLLQDDPITYHWLNHLQEFSVSTNQRVLFLRRWLSREHGELPSPVQAACWLDIKRSYMELRPHLRRVYLAVCDMQKYAPAAQRLGFGLIPDAEAKLDGATFHTAMLDFGTSSVDGWLSSLLDAEVGVQEENRLLDVDAVNSYSTAIASG